jgi:hypothetical protein
MADVRELLERYVEAKDRTRPELMPDIYRPDAVLTYSIATDEISFPARVQGVEAITRTLVSEFGERFAACRTYYLCHAPPVGNEDLVCLQWLVAMRERQSAQLRLGKGWYRWQFERRALGGMAARTMHIHIERMAAVPDRDGRLLAGIQRDLPYPWLRAAVLRRTMDELAASDPTFAFVHAFREPAALNA